MNHVVLSGWPTANPTIHLTANGNPLATYLLAVRRLYQGNGPGQQDADFISCVAFGRVAEFAMQHVRKGQRIAVEGRLQTNHYIDKDGNTRYVTQVVVNRHELTDTRRDGNAEVVAPATESNTASVLDSNGTVPAEVEDADLPL